MSKKAPNPPRRKAPVRLEYLRERKRRRKIQMGIAATVVLAGVIFYLTGLYGASVTFLVDAIDTIAIALKPGNGWPVKTNISKVIDTQPLAGGFLVLGETDLALYSNHGNQLRRIQHGFARPAISAGDTRFCLYSRTGSELRVENRSRTLYTQNFEQPILTAQMANNNSVGVLTRSARYTGELLVYNNEFSEIFHWYATEKEGTPYLMSFSPNSNRVAVGCLAPSGGVLGLNIQLLDVTKETPLALISLQNCKGYRIEWLTANTFLVVTDQFCAVFDEQGNEKARYSYIGKTLKTADINGKNTVLLFQEGDVVVLDSAMKVTAQTNVPLAEKVVIASEGAYIITETGVQGITLKGESLGKQAMAQEPQAVVQARDLMLFSSNQVDLLRLELLQQSSSENASSGTE